MFLVGTRPFFSFKKRRLTTAIGNDLAGNTYWEFKDSLKPGRFRRIVKASPKIHYADVKVSRKSGVDGLCG